MSADMKIPAAARAVHVASIAAAVIIAGHGLLHGIGVALLWRLGEPGSLRYADAHPAPGTFPAGVFGAMWLLAGLLFLATAAGLAAGREWWRRFAVAAVVVSVGAAVPSASIAVVGLAVDSVILVVVSVLVAVRHRRPTGHAAAGLP